MNSNQKSYFQSLPHADELYFTADGLCWRTLQQAQAHRATLIGEVFSDVEGFTREEYLAEMVDTTDHSNDTANSIKTSKGTGAAMTPVPNDGPLISNDGKPAENIIVTGNDPLLNEEGTPKILTPVETGTTSKKPFSRMSKTELITELDSRGIQADPIITNPELVKMIQEHDVKANQ